VRRRNESIEIVFLVYDGIQALDLTGPFEVFHGANQVLEQRAPGRTRYRLSVASTDGRTIETESGLQLGTIAICDAPQRPHTLVIPGGFGAQAAAGDDELVGHARRLGESAERVLTVCTGAFVAAAARLTDGHRVATHWARAEALGTRFPGLNVDPDPIFIHDGKLWSSAGVTAGIDLALAVVEHDHDAETAQVVARWLVMFLRRPGGQTQFATPVWTERAETAPVRAAQDMIDTEPGEDHRVGLLADRVGMSERHFTRCFTEQTGISPARYVSGVRVEAARRQLEITSDTVESIAARYGFGTAETMRRTFARRLGTSPDQYRQRFTTTATPTTTTTATPTTTPTATPTATPTTDITTERTHP
jgi:transcriptional regulator GlxA family with amidase domain